KTFNLLYDDMLGLDVRNPMIMEKNGKWGTGAQQIISTSAAVFGPCAGRSSDKCSGTSPGPRAIGVLVMNSNISGGPFAGKIASDVLLQAYRDALSPKK